ncbi:hypothetical protein ACYFX5_00235 [Bremerella sp. T1]|uniref:hypothetical protein n=1 Tax=Bremerella sp. TYQ1 TaxID=3119568 RepID=UPI001CCA4A4A|nr:hypothetical protein [Bremerella volcania]UBM36718.1 hypothetical protein LA756_02195 [Bremerella volcania]
MNSTRRQFLQAAGSLATSCCLPGFGFAHESTKQDPMVGVQIAPHSMLDEGIDRCLDLLQGEARVNTLFIYSQTYHMGVTPQNVLATDHGVPVRDPRKRNLPNYWVKSDHSEFAGGLIQHESHRDDFEYSDRDLFQEVRKPASDRGMKVYARILEAGGNRMDNIPGYRKVQTVDHLGHRSGGPCWNHPAYREWVFKTIEQLVTNYDLDGLQYGAERTGPMSHVLFRGETATCFCSHCIRRNHEKGINADRARQGYGKLYSLIKATEQNKARPNDGLLTEVLRILQQFPEVLSWDYQWFLADEEICTQVHHTAKAISPNIDSGRHVDHQRSSWDVFYRAAIPYSTMAENADFIKPILYHETFGPRLRWWVLERMKDRVLNELSLEQSLSLFYSTFGHTAEEMPQVEELDANGLGATYVYNETKRCKLGVGSHAKVYAGIGIDVPWYVPGGMEPRPSRPDSVEAAVVQAFEAGADGVLASREYNEMRLPSLRAFGQGVDQFLAAQSNPSSGS